MDITAGADRATEAGDDFIIAQIDMRAAAGTVSRCRSVADLVFALAFKAGNKTVALAIKQTQSEAFAT